MRLVQTISSMQSAPAAAFRGVKIVGFTTAEAEAVRALVSRVPPELLKYVETIQRVGWLGAKHGRYEPEKHRIVINPHTFDLKQRFGKGPGWIEHAELMIVHEVGHSIYLHLPPALQRQWEALGGWMRGWKPGQEKGYVEQRPGWPAYTSDWTHKKGLYLPRHYSEKNPDECFADCFAFCLLGKGFQMDVPLRRFVKDNVFQGLQTYPTVMIESPVKP